MKDDLTVAVQTLGSKIIETQITTLVLAELLVEKGIITAKEFDEKYKIGVERDFEKLRAELADLSKEFSQQNTETE